MANRKTALAVVEELRNRHDPLVPDGRAGIRKAITFLPDLHFGVREVIASGDWVTVALRVTGQGDTPKVIVDVFRFEGDRVAEHWDVTQGEAGAPALHRSSPGPFGQDGAQIVEKALSALPDLEPGLITSEGNEVFVHARHTGRITGRSSSPRSGCWATTEDSASPGRSCRRRCARRTTPTAT